MVGVSKRAFARNDCEAHITYAVYNTEKYFNAKMCNNGEGGMYFESDSLFKEGTNILFKVKTCSFETSVQEALSGLRTLSLAQVRWWKDMSSKDASRFGIGVKYY